MKIPMYKISCEKNYETRSSRISSGTVADTVAGTIAALIAADRIGR